MKILVGIPVISGADHCKMAIDSVVDEADVLIVDNNAPDDVKLAILREDVSAIQNQQNLYVNHAWNQLLQYFLRSKYETLIIMNSDLIMQKGWSEKLNAQQICVPTDGSHKEDVVVTEGTPGVFIHLNKEMANFIYPIPNYIKLWWGDYWIYSILRRLSYQTIVKAGLICNHYNGGSQSVNIVPNKQEIIDEDNKQWALHGEADIENRVKKYKRMKIGVGVTTTKNSEKWKGFNCCPENLWALRINTHQTTIAKDKNKLIKELYDAGCEYIFVFDEDCFPIKWDWEKLFLDTCEETGIQHFVLGNTEHLTLIEKQPKVTLFSTGTGCMIFLTREVIEKVGFINNAYGKYGYEHAAYSYRIHRAGFTPAWYVSANGWEEYLYSYDLDKESAKKHGFIKQSWVGEENKENYIADNDMIFHTEMASLQLYYPYE